MGERTTEFNVHPSDLAESDGGEYPSPIEDWVRRGIRVERTDPFPTKAHTTEQLKAMGMMGIRLHIPQGK